MKQNLIYLSLTAFLLTLFSCSTATVDQVESSDSNKSLLKGMELVWCDEFNDHKLDSSKWSTNYYSNFDMVAKTNYDDFLSNNLPQPAINFTDSTIILYTSDSLPSRAFWESGRKISSIQTYDWNSDQRKVGNYVGGFLEARLKRRSDKDATMVNGAFWIDSPGPEVKYYLEEGTEAFGVKGLRPRGQVFEVDLCEYITTEIVLHGNVDKEGTFERNIGHFIIEGDFQDKWVTHSMLWTPAGMKFYIDGKEVAQSWDPKDIKSPNHFMTVYLGMYAKGNADMEIDYVRFYQWKLPQGSELPNGDFEYEGELFPWEGSGSVSKDAAKSGQYGLSLKPNESVYQYVYLDHSSPYELILNGRGGKVNIEVDNIVMVSGESENNTAGSFELGDDFETKSLKFKTTSEKLDHKKTVRLKITNIGSSEVALDDITISK